MGRRDVTTNRNKNEQEIFWHGEFGDEYIKRNRSKELIASNTFMFAKILDYVNPLPDTLIEFGANIGANILAMQNLLPNCKFSGIEINKHASTELEKIGCKVFNGSIYDDIEFGVHDMVLSKGVLIHQDPTMLDSYYKKMYNCANNWIVIAEYFNPTPVQLDYRGFSNKLFKRDFASEFMDKYEDISLISSGFSYSRSNFSQDNINWFLFRKDIR